MKKLFLKFMMLAMLVPASFALQAQEDTTTASPTILEEVATTLNTKLDSVTFLEYQAKIQSLEATVEEMKTTFKQFEANKINSIADYENLYTIIMAILTSILTFLQRQGWLKNLKKGSGIFVVIGTGLALVLSATIFKGDWNVLEFGKEWFFVSGGGVFAWELLLKYIVKR